MSALAIESWTWYAITWLVVTARMISRRVLHGSFRKMQIDDGLMLFAMITDTVLMVSMNIVATTNTNLIDPNDHSVLTADSIKERTFGSKMVLVVEQMQILTIWTVKCCLLIMYSRLTMSLKQNVAVKIAAGYVAISFVFMEVMYLGVWCRPFQNYWAVPTPNIQCSAATNHLITNAVLNISSDIFIILIPMPILLAAQLPPKRKAILVGVFALGTFTILSAILNKYYSFNEPFGSMWTFWYIRESSTALITANLPFTWTLLRWAFNLRSFNANSSQHRSTELTSRFTKTNGTKRRTMLSGRHNNSGTANGGEEGPGFSRTDSQERINKIYTGPLKIYQQQEIRISTKTVDARAETDNESTRSFGLDSKPSSKELQLGVLPSHSGSDSESITSGKGGNGAGVVTTCRRF